MTVLSELYKTIEVPSRAEALHMRAKCAGTLVRYCAQLGTSFCGDVGGWRLIVGPLMEHRAMVAEDIGLEASHEN